MSDIVGQSVDLISLNNRVLIYTQTTTNNIINPLPSMILTVVFVLVMKTSLFLKFILYGHLQSSSLKMLTLHTHTCDSESCHCVDTLFGKICKT